MNYHRLVYFCKLVNHFCNHWETPKQAVVSGWSDFPLVLPHDRPFLGIWHSVRTKNYQVTEIFRELEPARNQGVTFWTKRIRLIIIKIWPWLQNQFDNHWFCNWCHILTNIGPILSVQNVTLRFLGVAASQIFFGNLPIFISHIISQFPKMLVTDCGNTISHQEWGCNFSWLVS